MLLLLLHSQADGSEGECPLPSLSALCTVSFCFRIAQEITILGLSVLSHTCLVATPILPDPNRKCVALMRMITFDYCMPIFVTLQSSLIPRLLT